MEFTNNQLIKFGTTSGPAKRASFTVAYKLSEILTNIGIKEDLVKETVKKSLEALIRYTDSAREKYTPIIAFTFRTGYLPHGSGPSEIEISLGALDFSEKKFKTENITYWLYLGGMQASPTFNCQVSLFRGFRNFYQNCHSFMEKTNSEEDLYTLLRYLLFPLMSLSSPLLLLDINEGYSPVVEKLFGNCSKIHLQNKYKSTNSNNMEMLLLRKADYTAIRNLRKGFESVPLLPYNVYASNELLFECH